MVSSATGILMLAVTILADGFSVALDVQSRAFFIDPAMEVQHRDSISLALAPRFETSWSEGRQALSVQLFGRVDTGDQQRTHIDIRELNWIGRFGLLELELGLSKTYWGVIESLHLVDVINQTDLVESFDGEQKLGQPILRVSIFDINVLGDFHLFYLPYFRERTFVGQGGRLRPLANIDTEATMLSTEFGAWMPGFAARWELSKGPADLGVSYFYGLSRDPLLIPTNTAFIPQYEPIHQIGLDLQLTLGAVLLKHESIARTYPRTHVPQEDFIAQASGLEYTFASVIQSMDIGLLTEYLWASTTNLLSPFDHHIFMGLRCSMNDTQDTQLLAGVVVGLESSEQLVSLEASRRLTEELLLTVEMRLFRVENQHSFLWALRRDAYVQLQLRFSL